MAVKKEKQEDFQGQIHTSLQFSLQCYSPKIPSGTKHLRQNPIDFFHFLSFNIK